MLGDRNWMTMYNVVCYTITVAIPKRCRSTFTLSNYLTVGCWTVYSSPIHYYTLWFIRVVANWTIDMSSNGVILLLCTVLNIVVSSNSQTVHKRFEYKYSFKPPYLAQKDGSVPFWEYGGSK